MSNNNSHTDSHQWVQDHLELWLDPADHSISEKEGERIEAHIQNCAQCKLTYDLLRDVYEAEEGDAEVRREAIPSFELDLDAGWARLEQDVADDYLILPKDTDSISVYWKQAAVWLIAGLLTGWGLTQGIDERLTGSDSSNTQLTEVWSEFENAASQDWVRTTDWTEEILNENQSSTESEE